MQVVPEIDQLLGIDIYVTKTNGTGGKIRRATTDFQVEEILVDGSKAHVYPLKTGVEPCALGATLEHQGHLLCVLSKHNWDTFIATRNVANQLGLGQNALQIAGIKDAKAVTAQYVTIENLSMQDVAKINVPGVQIRPVGYLRNPMSVFYLLGNCFKINITDITHDQTTVNTQINQIIQEVTRIGGIPNFYGHQRFGTTRPITHLVGKALLEGKYEEAAILFLANPSPNEHHESRKARIELQQTRDFRIALEHYPKQLRYERSMIRYLSEKPTEYLSAFNVLPMKLQALFVQAYQSYLFNRFLSERVKANLSLNKAEIGDFTVSVERNGLPMVNMPQIVTAQNQNRVNEAIATDKMRLVLPVVGFRQKLSAGLMGEIEQRVLQQENVNVDNFRITVHSRLGGKGSLRTALTPVKDFKIVETSKNADAVATTLEFKLLRGCYATILLREIMKPTDLIASGF